MLNRTSTFFVALLLLSITFLFTACSGSNTTAGSGGISARLVWSSKSASKSVAYAPAGVTKVRLAITGNGITTIQQDFTAIPGQPGSGTLTGVPAGSGYILTAYGLDSGNNILFQGTITGITIQSGRTTDAGLVTLLSTTIVYKGAVELLSLNGSGSPISGSVVSTVGLPNVITATTDSSGVFTLAGIPKGVPFSVHITSPSYSDIYSCNLTYSADYDGSLFPFGLHAPATITGFGNYSGNGIIRTRVINSTSTSLAAGGFIGGAVVTATDNATGTTYPVKYTNNTTGVTSNALSVTDPGNGIFTIVNIPAGHSVSVTASAAGYTFNTRTYVVQANAVSQGRLTGTATSSGSTGLFASALQSGFYILNKDSYTPASGTNSLLLYYYDSLSYNSSTMTLTSTAFFYNSSGGTWGASAPANFTPRTHYILSASGWTPVSGDTPNGDGLAFNPDGSATLSKTIDGSQHLLTTTSTDLTGRTIASTYAQYTWPIGTNTTATFPTGSLLYTIQDTPYDDSYTVWDSGHPLSTFSTVATDLPQIFIDKSNGADPSIEYYCTLSANNSATIFQVNSSVAPATTTNIGSATWSITTIRGQQILEIAIPQQVRTDYLLGGNPIVSIINSVAWTGSHPLPGMVDYAGGGIAFNPIALKFLQDNMTTNGSVSASW